MVRPDQDRIGGRPGEHVEVDETWVGGWTRGKGRGVHDKVVVVSAVEVRQQAGYQARQAEGWSLCRTGSARHRAGPKRGVALRLRSVPLCRARRSLPTTGAATPASPRNTSPSLNGAILRSPRSIYPSRLRKPENVVERHPSRGQSPAPASLPQRIHLPLQQAVLSVQRVPFPARHRGRRHRTDLRRALLRSLAAPYMLGVWVKTG